MAKVIDDEYEVNPREGGWVALLRVPEQWGFRVEVWGIKHGTDAFRRLRPDRVEILSDEGHCVTLHVYPEGVPDWVEDVYLTTAAAGPRIEIDDGELVWVDGEELPEGDTGE